PELLTRFGADGWELVVLQEHREGGMSNSYWDAVCSVATYTFKRPAPPPGDRPSRILGQPRSGRGKPEIAHKGLGCLFVPRVAQEPVSLVIVESCAASSAFNAFIGVRLVYW